MFIETFVILVIAMEFLSHKKAEKALVAIIFSINDLSIFQQKWQNFFFQSHNLKLFTLVERLELKVIEKYVSWVEVLDFYIFAHQSECFCTAFLRSDWLKKC